MGYYVKLLAFNVVLVFNLRWCLLGFFLTPFGRVFCPTLSGSLRSGRAAGGAPGHLAAPPFGLLRRQLPQVAAAVAA